MDIKTQLYTLEDIGLDIEFFEKQYKELDRSDAYRVLWFTEHPEHADYIDTVFMIASRFNLIKEHDDVLEKTVTDYEYYNDIALDRDSDDDEIEKLQENKEFFTFIGQLLEKLTALMEDKKEHFKDLKKRIKLSLADLEDDDLNERFEEVLYRFNY